MISFVTRLTTTSPSPEPYDTFTGDPNLVTPGVIGFSVMALIAVITIFLLIDMTRRMRVVKYREEARATIAAEQAAVELVQERAAESAEASTGDSDESTAPEKPVS